MADFLVLDVPTIGERKFVKSRGATGANSRVRRLFGQEMVLIKAEDFEVGWSRDSGYIPEDLLTGRRDGRRPKTFDHRFERFEKFLAENAVIETPNVGINAGGHIGVRDGRHRTRVLLNLGMEAIPVTMTKESVALFERYIDR